MTTPRASELADALLTYIAAGGRVQAQVDAVSGQTRYCVIDEGITLRIAERRESDGK